MKPPKIDQIIFSLNDVKVRDFHGFEEFMREVIDWARKSGPSFETSEHLMGTKSTIAVCISYELAYNRGVMLLHCL
jgi:hypothetical protein